MFHQLTLNRNFSLLWASQIINGLGNKFSIFALPLIGIYTYHTNALQTSVITALSFLPHLLLSPFVGAFVDRYDKQKITVISNAICSALSCLLFILSIVHLLPLALFYGFIFLLNSCMLFSGSAFNTQLPLILTKKQLKEGNYRLSVSDSIVSMIAPSLAGMLLAIVMPPLVFLIDAITFALASWLQSRVTLIVKYQHRQHHSYIQQIKTSYLYVFHHPMLSRLALSYLMIVFSIGIFQSIQMYYLSQVLKIDSQTIGILFTIANIGTLIMSLSTLKISKWLGSGKTIIISLSLYALGFTCYLLGSKTMIGWIIVGQLLTSMALPLYNINVLTLRQTLVSIDKLGSVSAIFALIGRGLIPLGATLSGLLTLYLSLQSIIILTVVIATIGILPILLSKEIRVYQDV